MYEIISKRLLNSHEIYRMEIHAPWISLSGKPGQFVIVIPHETGDAYLSLSATSFTNASRWSSSSRWLAKLHVNWPR